MAWLGAIAGAWVAKEGADKANAQNAKGGWTDVTTTTSPSDQSAGYRNWAMQQAYGILNPNDPTPAWKGPYNNGSPGNRPGEGPAGSGGPNPGGNPDPNVVYANGKTVIPKPTGKGGKGGKNPTDPLKPGKPGQAPDGKWTGQSDQTRTVVDAAVKQAQKGNPLYGEAEGFISDTLAGQDRNGYRTETADMVRGMDDPDIRRLKDMLFQDVEGSRPRGGGATGGGPKVHYGTVNSAYASNPTYTPSPTEGPVGVVDDIKALLAGQGAPQNVKDAIARRNEEEWNKRIADKMGLYVGNGNMGSSNWTQALGDVNTTSARELGDSLAMADYGLYQHGLDLGTGYDTAYLDRNSREKIASEDRAQSAANSSNAAGASAAALKGQMDLARLDALQNAVGMGQRQNEFRSSAMGSLADLFGQDQRFALGATPDITGLGMRDWTAAGQLSLGSDQNRNSFDIGKRNADAARAGVNATNQRLAFDQQRYQHDVPFMDLSRYMDIVNASDRGGTSRTFGQTPSGLGSINSGAAAVGGAAAGWSLGNAYQQTYGSGK